MSQISSESELGEPRIGSQEQTTTGEGFITKAELASRLKRSRRTIDNLMKARRIPFIKLNGRSVLFDWAAVRSHIQDNYTVRPRCTPTPSRPSLVAA